MKNILITGSSGFIANFFDQALRNKKFKIYGLDKESSSKGGSCLFPTEE